MKVPVPPPPETGPPSGSAEEAWAFLALIDEADIATTYRPWDTFRHLPPPAGVTVEKWWAATRRKRRSAAREIPLYDVSGRPFSYNLPDEVMRLSEDLARRASGVMGTAERLAHDANRTRYLVSSLMEEAISSSQLEGAVTSRGDAKRMLESGREPRSHSERMIVNNFAAMSLLRERLDEDITPELIRDIHVVVTEGTLDDPADAGRIQTDDSRRVRIFGDGDQVLHTPPPAAELEERMATLCAFLTDDTHYMPPALKAITAHFMLGYDHYFADGNGRTARAVFYWVMLKEGYWLTEYLVVSQLLKVGPAKYARSFLLTEDDGGDLTHFFLFHLQIIHRSLDRLDAYLNDQTVKAATVRRALNADRSLNHRQIDVLERASSNPESVFDVRSVARTHRVSEEAARRDLLTLEEADYLDRGKDGRRRIWRAAPGLEGRILSGRRGLGPDSTDAN